MKHIKLIFFLVVNLTWSHKAVPQVSSIDSLLFRLTKTLKKEHIPGAMLSIVTSDTVIFTGGIGLANIEKQAKRMRFYLWAASLSFIMMPISFIGFRLWAY